MVAEKSGRTRSFRPLVLIAAGATAAALAVPAASAAELPSGSGFAPNVEPKAVSALAASAGITPSQAMRSLRTQSGSKALAQRLTRDLGDRAAGAYLDQRADRPVVNVLDATAAAQVRATGATPKLVRHSTAALHAAAARLDRLPKVANTAYGVDPSTDQVVVTIARGAAGPGVTNLLAAVRDLGDQAKVKYSTGALTKQVANGDEISTGQIICSAGFNVTQDGQNFIIDAGHCTQGLPDWIGIGPSVDSQFPGTDYGLIRNDSSDSSGAVNTYDGGSQTITQAGDAQVGESVCKSGRTTHVTCGTVQAVDQTVNYSDGLGGIQTVHGLIQTNVYADHGDSGGPLYDGETGLGTVSGGDSTTDFFQPLTPALNAYGAKLS